MSEFAQRLTIAGSGLHANLIARPGMRVAATSSNQSGADLIQPFSIAAEETDMSKDERDILELLRTELDYIEKGGYGRSVRTPWKETSPFRDSLTCVNYALPEKAHPCDECHLIDFVPAEKRDELVPCHFIPLTEGGETVEDFEIEGNQAKMEEALKQWMRHKIAQLEVERSAKVNSV